MGSLSGIQRPLVAAVAVAMASVSGDLSERFQSLMSSLSCSTSKQIDSYISNPVKEEANSSWVSHVPVSRLANLSFVTGIRVPIPNINFPICNSTRISVPTMLCSPIISSPVLVNLYNSAQLAKASMPNALVDSVPTLPTDVLYRWHLPEPNSIDVSGTPDCSLAKSRTVVVLLGWLGSKQKHLKRYAEWYTSRGFHVITFTFPMSEVISYQVGGKAEQNVELLVNHLADWLEEEHGKNLVFHTFSNTGWLTYGAILEKFHRQDPSLVGRIRGCIVDSAPVAVADPQVWASGFSAAFLKKHSVATKGSTSSNESDIGSKEVGEPKPAVTETALLLVLEKFFELVLNLPTVHRRLSDVLGLLSSRQPKCPQLYIYSSADRVIPAESVESFIEEQRRAGHEVWACNFVSTPHVDHFRNDPKLYTTQLSQFLEDCVLTCSKRS
ncbi:DUF829 domain-containing protein [Cephalotus follicularis]|uniref:DUF829 domain-containing protein n=1 Tax=Cephalotus follicularis TaxID=3775 RepID=A0A1Q3BXX2_CEPFO|nr:DUF829 domain-containing protein [Cephalotus follicularis]